MIILPKLTHSYDTDLISSICIFSRPAPQGPNMGTNQSKTVVRRILSLDHTHAVGARTKDHKSHGKESYVCV